MRHHSRNFLLFTVLIFVIGAVFLFWNTPTAYATITCTESCGAWPGCGSCTTIWLPPWDAGCVPDTWTCTDASGSGSYCSGDTKTSYSYGYSCGSSEGECDWSFDSSDYDCNDNNFCSGSKECQTYDYTCKTSSSGTAYCGFDSYVNDDSCIGECTSGECNPGGGSCVAACDPDSKSTACSGLECGTVSDGCDGTHDCGSCTSYCDTGGDANYYCSGGDVRVNYDYWGASCSASNTCGGSWDYNSCGDALHDNCSASEECVEGPGSHDASCEPVCDANQDDDCNINACGEVGGTIQCNGTCSGDTPPNPPLYNNACTSSANVCGDTSSGNIQCNGTCDATKPADPSSCTSSENNVGETSSGYDCDDDGVCDATAPADKTLTVSASADPSSGDKPLNNVSITASVSGTATGNIVYKLDCTNNGTWEATTGSTSSTSYTFTTKCDYSSAGSYTVKVQATRQTLSDTDTTTITVTTPCDSSSYTSCSAAKDFESSGSTGDMCGADQYYKVTVPSGQICDALWSMTPDVGVDYDIYVKWSSSSCPATGTWDCRPYESSGTNELCTTTGLSAGTYKAFVHRYSGTGSYAIAGVAYNCVSSDTAAPTVTVTGEPSSWQDSNATEWSIACDDGSGSGCDTSSIKYMTPETDPGTCPDATTQDGRNQYSGTYSGSFAIQEQRWMCAMAKDNVGNWGYTSSPVHFKVDKTDPTQPSTPSVSTPTYDTTPTWSWTASTDTGGSELSGYTVQWCNNSTFPSTCDSNTSTANSSPFTSTTAFAQGTWYFRVKAQDGAGNSSVFSGNRSVLIDTTPPSVGNISPTTATINTSTSFSAEVSDTGGSGLNRCDLYDSYNFWGESMAISGTTASVDHTFSTLGSNTVYVSCFDGAGNIKISSTVDINVVEPTLSFPTGTWERLWYSNPKDSNFSGPSYEGKDTIGNIDKNWGGGTLYDGQNNTIGFKAGRTFTGLTSGAYTISVGADDGIKLFVNGGSNLLPSSAWSSNHSWDDNKHSVHVELSSTAQIEIHYRENTRNAKITFAYSLGVVPSSSPQCSERTSNWAFYCGESPGPYYPPCDFYETGGTCYYDSPATGCGINECTYTTRTCSYNSTCTLQAGQTCTSQGCTEGTPPAIDTSNVDYNQWERANYLLDINVDFSDNIGLSSVEYKVGSGGTWKTPTTNGTSSISLSGASYTIEWNIHNDDWNAMGQGEHTIYVRAQDTSGNKIGYDDSKYFKIRKDSIAPTLSVTKIKRTSPSDQVQDLGTPTSSTWLKEGIYEVSISVQDPGAGATPTTGSNVDTGYRAVVIKSLDDTREYSPSLITYNKFSVWVGPAGSSLNDCVDEEERRCRVIITVRDNAGNDKAYPFYFNVDYTEPDAY